MGKNKKRILFWSFSTDDWMVCDNILGRFFENEDVEIIKASFMTPHPEDLETIDVALVTLSEWFYFVKKLLPENTPVLWIKYTISKADYHRIADTARYECVSVVADTPLYAERQYRMLITMGIREDRMKVWYIGREKKDLNRMVLLFERAGLEETADHEYLHFHGQGLICTETLMQLAVALDMPHLLQTSFYTQYHEETVYTSRQIGDVVEMGDCYAMYLNKTVNGILYFVPGERISYYSYNAATLLGVTPHELVGKTLEEVFPFLNKWIDHINDFGERVVNWRGRELSFDIWTTPTHGSVAGYILVSDYKAEKEKELRLRTRMLKTHQYAKYTFANIIGNSAIMQHCRETAQKFARCRSTVLITGASGTGKELFASAIHNASARKKGPFVAINCGAVVESLLESELFGYEAGAFTGARKEGKQGLFEMAHEGTLFLDEIGEMPMGLQVKLLRVLQEREVVRVGGQQVIPVDVRIVAATNRNLQEQVEAGQFRADLYYRLNVLPLELPGLNERREDILQLFYYIRDSEQFRFELDPEAAHCIEAYNYQGNVRELHNCVEYLGSLEEKMISYEELPPYMKRRKRIQELPVPVITEGVTEAISEEITEESLVLQVICSLLNQRRSAGRTSIHTELQKQGHSISEMRIRKILDQLSSDGKIERGRGRTGIMLKSCGG